MWELSGMRVVSRRFGVVCWFHHQGRFMTWAWGVTCPTAGDEHRVQFLKHNSNARCTLQYTTHNCSGHRATLQLPSSTKCNLKCIYITQPNLTQRNSSFTDIWRAIWHSARTVPTVCPVRVIWYSHRTGMCHLALSTYWYVAPGTQHVHVLAIWHSDRTATCHLALSTILPTICPVRVIWHSDRTGICHLALSTYRYVPSDTQHVLVRATWHSARTGTCHLALRSYRYVPPGTQHYPTNGMSGTCHLALRSSRYVPPGIQHV